MPPAPPEPYNQGADPLDQKNKCHPEQSAATFIACEKLPSTGAQ
jgi:hypothetical protein